jgi:hypothetical protein
MPAPFLGIFYTREAQRSGMAWMMHEDVGPLSTREPDHSTRQGSLDSFSTTAKTG